jgi:hypothetical protein
MTPTSTDNDEDARKPPLIRSSHYRMHSDTDTIDLWMEQNGAVRRAVEQ